MNVDERRWMYGRKATNEQSSSMYTHSNTVQPVSTLTHLVGGPVLQRRQQQKVRLPLLLVLVRLLRRIGALQRGCERLCL